MLVVRRVEPVGGTTSLSSLSDCIEAVGIGCDDERSREPENMACKVLATSKSRVHGNACSLKRDTRTIEFGDLARKQQQAKQQQATFGAHFVEVAVDAATAEVRVRRMLAVCASGRILNPKAARSQVIGAMTMGVGAALMEELVVDKRVGFFVNHDLASYEVPVHADIPHQEVVFLEETDPMSSPMKAKGVAELGICGVAAAVANAVYNAIGVRVRDYPITLDKLFDRLPGVSYCQFPVPLNATDFSAAFSGSDLQNRRFRTFRCRPENQAYCATDCRSARSTCGHEPGAVCPPTATRAGQLCVRAGCTVDSGRSFGRTHPTASRPKESDLRTLALRQRFICALAYRAAFALDAPYSQVELAAR